MKSDALCACRLDIVLDIYILYVTSRAELVGT